MRKSVVFILLGLFLCLIGKGVYVLKSGFHPRRVAADVGPFSHKVNHPALSQLFHYVGRGRQCFAFASEDGQYILKCIRMDRYHLPFWARCLKSQKAKLEMQKVLQERAAFIFNSCQIAFHELAEETGVIALHLGRTEDGRKITLVDHSGYRHKVKLGEIAFVLQRRYPLWLTEFKAAVGRSDLSSARKLLDAWLDVVAKRASHGVINRDRGFFGNYGWDGKNVYQIDIGDFYRQPLSFSELREKSIRDSSDAVLEWLEIFSPELAAYFSLRRKDFF